jgi:hypothetical protein
VFVTLNDFQRGNFKPYVLRSADLGRTWTSIVGDLPLHDPAWTIVQDPVKPGLLFLGTEFGLSFTPDGGQHWMRLKGGRPTIAVRDLEIQKRESDLVAASFGRGFFVLDDYAPLRGIGAETLSQEAVLFGVGRKTQAYEEIGYYRAQGDNVASPNPPMGALLTYYLREDAPSGAKVVLTVTDSAGKQVRQIDASGTAGLHRTPWDLREAAPPAAGRSGAPAVEPADEEAQPVAARGGRGGRGRGGGRGGFARLGPLVRPGIYTVTLGRSAGGAGTAIAPAQRVEVE